MGRLSFPFFCSLFIKSRLLPLPGRKMKLAHAPRRAATGCSFSFSLRPLMAQSIPLENWLPFFLRIGLTGLSRQGVDAAAHAKGLPFLLSFFPVSNLAILSLPLPWSKDNCSPCPYFQWDFSFVVFTSLLSPPHLNMYFAPNDRKPKNYFLVHSIYG